MYYGRICYKLPTYKSPELLQKNIDRNSSVFSIFWTCLCSHQTGCWMRLSCWTTTT